MRHVRTLLAGIVFCLSGCSGIKVEDYSGQGPALDIRDYLNGDLEAWGVFIGMDGKADPQFYIKMKGSWNGNEGTLAEEFTYHDGTKKNRLWTFRFTDDHHFTGTASDVVGTGHGGQYGNAVNMKYTLQVPFKGRTINVSMDDWLYLIDQKNLVNRTEMRKFGFKVGELVISFRKK